MNLVKEVSITKCNEHDLNDLIELAATTFRDTYKSLIPTRYIGKYLSEHFSDQHFFAILNSPHKINFIARLDSDVAGFMEINFSASQRIIKDPRSLEIERIYVRQQYKRMGLGSRLFQIARETAMDYSMKYLWLNVFRKNTDAIEFYKKLGFATFGVCKSKFSWDENVQYDLIMKHNCQSK